MVIPIPSAENLLLDRVCFASRCRSTRHQANVMIRATKTCPNGLHRALSRHRQHPKRKNNWIDDTAWATPCGLGSTTPDNEMGEG